MSVYEHQGKYRWEYQRNKVRYRGPCYATREEAEVAERKAREREANLNLNFKKLCEGRLRELKRYRTQQYLKENDKLINNLIVIWAFKPEITRDDVEDYLDTIESPYVRNKYLRFIKALFNYGINREWFTYNPAGKIKFMGVKRNEKYIPSRQDIQKVLRVVNEEQRQYLLVIINTLGRISEINNLRWEDVHEDYLILRTRKSKNSNLTIRKIPFNKTLKEIFEGRKEKREGYVFSYRGKPIRYRSKFLKSACKQAGIKEFTYHCLRHYGASVLANAGVALTDIQVLLGHQRPTTTDIYLQSIKNSVKVAVKNLEDI
jgi:integrase